MTRIDKIGVWLFWVNLISAAVLLALGIRAGWLNVTAAMLVCWALTS